MKIVYKIMSLSEWEAMSESGVFSGSPIDRKDGYIHLSSASQVEETVVRHFADRGALIIVAVAVESLGAALRFEPSRGGELFPHAYSELKAKDVLWSREFSSDKLDGLRKLIAE